MPLEPVMDEWPSFTGVPEEETLPAARPKGQALARFAWWDGEVKEASSVSVHYYSNALHYGTAVFEGIRVYPVKDGAAIFRLRDHVNRLFASAALYGMKIPFSADELVEGALAVTRRNGIKDGYLRPLAFFGEGPIDITPKKSCPVRVLIAIRTLGTFLGDSALRNGIRATVSSWRKLHHTMVPTMAKAAGHYVNNVLAAHEAIDRGFDDAILLNQDGTVSSATGSNVFFVKKGVLHTNDESSSIVPGITRDSVLVLAKDAGVPTLVRPFTREEMMRADEVFFTGTAAEITPLREIDGISLETGKKTLGAGLQQAYLRACAGKDDKHEDWLTSV